MIKRGEGLGVIAKCAAHLKRSIFQIMFSSSLYVVVVEWDQMFGLNLKFINQVRACYGNYMAFSKQKGAVLHSFNIRHVNNQVIPD